METLQIINTAMDYAKQKVEEHEFTDVQKMSNGSEAWQAVQIITKNKRKLQNQLKKIGYKADYYWGYTVSAPYSNFFFEEVWTEAFADSMTRQGFESRRVERLL